MKSAMGLGYRVSKRETRHQHQNDCKTPLNSKRRKDDDLYKGLPELRRRRRR